MSLETQLLDNVIEQEAAGKYIDIASSYNFEEDSLLDQQRQKLSVMEMQTIITMAKSISTKLSKKKLFQKIEKLYVKIEALVTDCKLEFVGRCVMKPTVKTVEEAYAPPKFPPRLSWHQVYNKNDVSAEILAAIELLELSQDSEDATDDRTITRIPPDIKPNLVNHRIEVVFWGMRDLKKLQMSQVNKPKIVIECVNEAVTSDTLTNAKKCLNFPNPVIAFEVMFPEQQEYAPPLSLKMFDCRNFGISVYAGTHIVPMWIFFYQPITMQERERKFLSVQRSFVKQIEESRKIDPKEEDISKKKDSLFKRICRCICFKRRIEEKPSVIFDDAEFVESDDFDWWTKFYASLEVYFDNKASDVTNLGIHFQELPSDTRTSLANKYKLKIYPNELESQPEFGGFADLLHVFPMYKGKRTGDETVDEQNTTGVFKGSLRVYRWPLLGDYVTASGLPMHKGVFQDFPSNLALRFVLRVYCVRALGLRPRDLNGKSDPYLHVTLANRAISDKANCIKGQINPIFGRCFELGGVFPQDHTVTIAVYDWDAVGRDDLIGQTKIDLENRFYTKHRAHCGIAEDYLTSGYCQWRDANKPTVILENLCRKWNIGDPEYGATSVIVARKEFSPKNFAISDNKEFDRQVLALTALRRWAEVPVVGCALVPEHVETRSLYNPNKPGIEQGKLQLWVDVFPVADLPTPKQVNIAPRKPVAYELRVVVWNAENIKMDEDDFFTGEKKSDVFIRGWEIAICILGFICGFSSWLTVPENSQYTDVHYRSLSGEANFNWRFIFPFEYLSTENRIVLKEKSPFGFDERENKIPCRLTLQSWDNDTFSSHDFLGILTLELSRLPRGARVAKTCSLSILQSNAPVLNLFKIRRTRGWWPLKAVDAETESEIFAGALELEFELLKKEDAENSPAGKGRNEPQALPKPKYVILESNFENCTFLNFSRPDTSFSWFRNPLKAFKFVLKLHKWKLIKIGIFVALVFIVFAAFYAIPGYSVKKILGA
ncbi:otoferlin [Asbolus verrucosus]|uniref:Otoferlin n=1 Tax=Asbolus verrucosus TaxID=1661398 RepID=A0A482VW72_ASBVE|nr:otoferlin [Asbolus verrucosus]